MGRKAEGPLEERIRRLEAELAGLRQSVRDFGGSEADARAAQAQLHWLPVAEPHPGQADAVIQPPPWPAPPPAAEASLEFRFGGRVLAVIGITIVALGAGIFYALVHNSIPAGAKFMGGLAAGTGLWAVGWRLQGRGEWWHSDLATAGGAIVAYLTCFAGFAMEPFARELGLGTSILVPAVATIAAALFADAWLRHRQALLGMAVFLVWLTSLQTDPLPAFLLLYTTVLTCAIVLASLVRGWTWPALAAIPVAYLAVLDHLQAAPWVAITASVLLLAFYTTGAFLRWGPVQAEAGRGLPYVHGAAWLASALCIALAVDQLSFGIAWPLMGLALVALALAALPGAPAPARPGWGVAGLVLLAAWAPFQFQDSWTLVAWGALCAGIAVLHGRRPSTGFVAAGLAIAALLAIGVLAFSLPWVNEPAWRLTVACAVAAFGPLPMWWRTRKASAQQPASVAFFSLATTAVLAIPLIWLDGPVVSTVWALLATAMLVAGFRLDEPAPRLAALGVFGLVTLRILLLDFMSANALVRVFSFIAVGVILFLASLVYARRTRAAAAIRVGPAPQR